MALSISAGAQGAGASLRLTVGQPLSSSDQAKLAAESFAYDTADMISNERSLNHKLAETSQLEALVQSPSVLDRFSVGQ